ncbi:MAG: polyprenyl synthetase family protein [Treponemataceae bacterium]|nr:polyprenyl synthetase family protein [Treponemataceae bacterium]
MGKNKRLSEFSIYRERVEDALQRALPKQAEFPWQADAFGALPDCIRKNHIAPLLEPCRSLLLSGGKRWRPILLLLCAELARQSGRTGGVDADGADALTPLVEFVHMASLIHDDIEDSSETRRGRPAAHITYGVDAALNAGSWLYFAAASCIEACAAGAEFKNTLYALYTKELRRLHLGQAMDISWHRSPNAFPTVEEYAAMVHCKTGTLASLAVQTGLLAGGASPAEAAAAGCIAEALGEGFQILDDVQNLTTGNPGKERGDDIIEGKKSFPLLLHIKNCPQDKKRLSAYLKSAAKKGTGATAAASIEQCIALLESSGATAAAAERGRSLVEENSRLLSDIFGTRNSAPAARKIEQLFAAMLPEGA